METLKKIVLGKRGLSFYFIVAGVIFTLATLITYATTGITAFTPVLSGKVLGLLSVCLVLCAVFAVLEVKVGKYLAYAFCFWTWLEYIISEMPYISNVLVAIDGNSFSATFILTVLFGLLAWALVLVSAILQKKEIGYPEAQTAEEAQK